MKSSVKEERFEFRMQLRRRQSGAGLIDAGLRRPWLTKLLGKNIPHAVPEHDLLASFIPEGRWRVTVSDERVFLLR